MGKFACVVFNCNMRTYGMTPEQKKLSLSEYLVSFHKFPSDLKKQKLWTKALGNEDWVPSTDSVVCSLHFSSDCYDENNKLLDSAVPSIVFDDFKDHLKLILDAIEKEKSGEIKFDDKNSSNNEPKAAKEVEAEAFDSSDSDFEIECEEILISGESDDEKADDVVASTSIEPETSIATAPTKSPQPSKSKQVPVTPFTSKNVDKPAAKTTNSSANVSISSIKTKTTFVPSATESKSATENAVTSKTSAVPPEVTIGDDFDSTDSAKETTVPSKNTASNSEPSIPKLHNISTKEDTSDQARQLYSMIQSGSFQNFPVVQPASKNLVRQLLDIVKLANSKNQSSFSGDENIPNTYIITTKYDDPNSTAKVKLVETTDVISMITQTVQAIKDGTYEKSDDLVIICGSPAIFLIKNVSVKTFDPSMNSVYVITTENLISYLYLLSTKAKPPRKIAAKPESEISSPANASKTALSTAKTASKNQKISFASLATKIIPQKLLSSALLNSSTPSVATSLSKNSPLRPILPAPSQNASLSIIPVTVASLCASTTDTRPVQSLSAVKGVPLISRPIATVTKNTPVTSITSAPFSSNLLIATSSAGSLVIPSKSSAFQAPKTAIAPFNAMRNNMANLKRKIDEIHKPNLTAPSKDSPAKSIPSLVVTQSLTSSNITLPRVVGTTLNKTGLVKLTFAPVLSSISTPTGQPLKPLQPSDKAQFVRLEPSKLGVKLDVVGQKRKINDFVTIDPSSKRIGIENKNADTSTAFASNVTVTKPIAAIISKPIAPIEPMSPLRSASPDVPSPVGVDVDSDSEEERPLSPRAAQRLLATQRSQIRTLEQNIIKRERDILALRKKMQTLRKRCSAAKKTADSKPDEQLVEDILTKYLDNDAVQFFVGQLKMSGKTFTQFRWTEEDKLFALGLLYRNPVEYNVLVQRFTLPSDKTLNKFVSRIKKAEMDANVTV